ncbi:replication-relaxation family protein, partial [Kitasatospora sp. NPDC085895]|uniref:replication-relaxation family protein n=1 Tax=Kitasatospora sp. NPDC085895 TaxID=3155057 RepID=UPI00344CBF6B
GGRGRLTGPGLDSAAAVRKSGPPSGGTAKGAALTGAPHAMAVNEAIIACLPDTGSIASSATEVEHPIATRQVVRTDAVLRSRELGLPVIFFEIDCGTMKESLVAAKIPRHLDYLTCTVRAGNDEVLHWHRLYGRPDHKAGLQPLSGGRPEPNLHLRRTAP